LAADIRAELGIDPHLIEGGGGIFEVKVDGERIFSKRDAGRFPESAEIIARMRS